MDPYADHAAGLAQYEAELGDACPIFQWNGKVWKITAFVAEYQKSLVVGGFQVDSRLVFTTLTAQFLPKIPEDIKTAMLETEMTYKGSPWIIKKVDILGLQFQIEASQVSP